jgi:hypothetical protein
MNKYSLARSVPLHPAHCQSPFSEIVFVKKAARFVHGITKFKQFNSGITIIHLEMYEAGLLIALISNSFLLLKDV